MVKSTSWNDFWTPILAEQNYLIRQRSRDHISKLPHWALESRAGRSPIFQEPGTPLVGLAGTRVPVSSIEEVLSFKISPHLSR